MDNIKEYIKIIEKELLRVNCSIESIFFDKDDMNTFDAVFININTEKDLDVVCNIFTKYNFKMFDTTAYLTTYYRIIDDILFEIRHNGLKELIR